MTGLYRLLITASRLTIPWVVAAASAAAASESELLVPGVVLEQRLAAGQSHTWRIRPATAAVRWQIRLDQAGVDVELSFHRQGASETWRVDSPIDRDGPELLLLPSQLSEPAELTVRALATTGVPGTYRVHLEAVREPIGRRVAALEVMTEAGRSYAEGGAVGRRRALTRYREAVDLWRQVGEPRLAAQCLYSAAVLHRLLGEVSPGLELARRV